MRCLGIILLTVFICQPLVAEEKPAGIPNGYKLLHSTDFSKVDALKEFQPTDPNAWRLGMDAGVAFLEQHQQSNYKPVHRSPFNYALLARKTFGDCIIDIVCQQTSKEYAHRDMIFVLGYQNPSQFYYVHIASKADDHANNVFIVKEGPRLKISKETNAGNDWGTKVWKHVRIERKVTDGTIKVFFDDMTKPIMRAEDKSFGSGWIGVGTFDDTSRISSLKIWGEKAEEKAVAPFPK